jgi:hypothetical protein
LLGLVIIPNKDHERENAQRTADIINGIHIGEKLIPWKAVCFANLCVTVEKSGNVRVSRHDRCQFCEQEYPIPQAWEISFRVRR